MTPETLAADRTETRTRRRIVYRSGPPVGSLALDGEDFYTAGTRNFNSDVDEAMRVEFKAAMGYVDLGSSDDGPSEQGHQNDPGAQTVNRFGMLFVPVIPGQETV